MQLQRNLPTFDELNEIDGINAIKFEAARLSDVFVAVAVVVAFSAYCMCKSCVTGPTVYRPYPKSCYRRSVMIWNKPSAHNITLQCR